MLRLSSRKLFVGTAILSCPANTSAFGKNPFESKFADRRPDEAGAVLAASYASRFAEHHKQKQAEGETPEDVKRAEQVEELMQKGFKDSRKIEKRDLTNDKQGHEDLRKKLIYQSRYRGMAELDLVMGSFAQVALPEATSDQLYEYDAILRELDTDLFHWLITIPGRIKDAAASGGKQTLSHKDATKASILSGTSDYPQSSDNSEEVKGATPTVDDEFVEPKELLEAEWHRRDDIPENLRNNSMFRKLQAFCEDGRDDIVKYR